MKIAAARALAGMVTPAELAPDFVIPLATNMDIAPTVAAAVAKAAIDSGIARNPMDPQAVADNLRKRLANQVKQGPA